MQAIKIMALTQVAAASLAAHRFIGFDGNYAAAGDDALGTTEYDAEPGDPVSIEALGVTRAQAGGPFDKGDALEVGADGKVVVLAAGKRVAKALQDSAGDGSIVGVFLTP